MGKFGDYIKIKKNNISDTIKSNRMTILLTIILSIVYVIVDIKYVENKNMIENIFLFLIFSIFGAFFIESLITNRNIKKNKIVVLHLINFIISFILDIVCQHTFNDIVDMNIEKGVVFCYGSLTLISLYTIYKNNNIAFGEYLARISFGLLRIVGLLLALNIATIMLLELIDSLIIEIDIWDFVSNIEILLCSTVYMPIALDQLKNAKEENSKFTKKFVLYALMSCVIIATGIMYVYIIKILFLSEKPSNEIFMICANLFLYSAPIWLMSKAFLEESKTKNLYYKIVTNMKYVYSPFIILEIYSIGVRIFEYGITPDRYMGVMFILFQITFIFIDLLYKLINRKKENFEEHKKYKILVCVAIVGAFISLIAPGINFNRISFISQKKRFESNIDVDDKKAAGAYMYLENDIYGEEYINNNFDDEIKEKYKKVQHGLDYREKGRIHYSQNEEIGVDIKEYSRLYKVDYREKNIKDDKIIIEIEYGNGNKCSVDIKESFEYFKDINEKYSSTDKLNDQVYKVKIDDDKDFYFTTLNASYYKDNDQLIEVYGRGYILEK